MEVNLKRGEMGTYHRQLRPMSSKQNLTCNVCLEAGFAENDFVNATKKILRTRTQPRTFPQGP